MNKALSFIRHMVARACVLTTPLVLIMYIISVSSTGHGYLNVKDYCILLIYALFLSATVDILHLRMLHILVRILMQYGILLLSFFLVFGIGDKITVNAQGVLIFTFAFSLLFLLLWGLATPIIRVTGYYEKHMAAEIKMQEKAPYQKRF